MCRYVSPPCRTRCAMKSLDADRPAAAVTGRSARWRRGVQGPAMCVFRSAHYVETYQSPQVNSETTNPPPPSRSKSRAGGPRRYCQTHPEAPLDVYAIEHFTDHTEEGDNCRRGVQLVCVTPGLHGTLQTQFSSQKSQNGKSVSLQNRQHTVIAFSDASIYVQSPCCHLRRPW